MNLLVELHVVYVPHGTLPRFKRPYLSLRDIKSRLFLKRKEQTILGTISRLSPNLDHAQGQNCARHKERSRKRTEFESF